MDRAWQCYEIVNSVSYAASFVSTSVVAVGAYVGIVCVIASVLVNHESFGFMTLRG